MSVYSVDKLISEARRLAADYRRVTGKPLAGVSGEIAQHDTARLMNLEICNPSPGGYDAIGHGSREGKRIQIKGRAIFDEGKSGQRIGQLKIEQQWDSIMLVVMDENLEPYEIYEAAREDILQALDDAPSNKRSKRGAMSVAKFKNTSRLVWTLRNGLEDDEVWDNQASY
jgi:hypothetical protein